MIHAPTTPSPIKEAGSPLPVTPTTLDSIEFTEHETTICVQLFTINEKFGILANELFQSLKSRGVFTESITFAAIMNDRRLESILIGTFRSCLSSSMKTSSYGKFLHNGVINTIVDDFTLYQMPPKAIDKLCEN